jgi:plastocyanin
MKNLLFTLTLLISLSLFSQDYAISVTADSRNDYKLVGIDSNGEINGLDVDLIFKNGSEIVFNVNSPGHPIVIKSQPGIGKKNILKEVKNNNISKGVVKWTPTSPGIYYYQCIKHKNMYGKIIIR